MYHFDSRVRYSEVDADKKLTIENVVNYFQDCSTFQSEDLGVGIDYLKERDQVWVLNFWQIVIDRVPLIGDRISIHTRPHQLKGFMGMRNFYMKDEAGEIIVKANSYWSLISISEQKPILIPQEMYDKYVLAEKLDMEYAPRKIKLPQEADTFEGEPVLIRFEHLDSNHHVNNGQYIHLALPYLPEDFLVKELRAEYKKQAFLGAIMHPVVYRFKENEKENIIVSLNDDDGKPYAVVHFM